jgi:hypothetical protein
MTVSPLITACVIACSHFSPSGLSNTNSMLQKLKDEKGEYGARKDLLEKERQFIDGDCILAASMMV